MEEVVRSLRLKGLSLSRICKEVGISKSTASKYVKEVEKTFSTEELMEVRKLLGVNFLAENASKLEEFRIIEKAKTNEESEIKVRESIEERRLLLEGLDSFSKGTAAEYLAKYNFVRRGFTVLEPSFTVKALDFVVVGKETGKFYRVEVKGFTSDSKSCKIRRTSPFTRKEVLYTEKDKIDYFILVDLVREIIAIVPFGEVDSTALVISPNSRLWEFVNRFDLLS